MSYEKHTQYRSSDNVETGPVLNNYGMPTDKTRINQLQYSVSDPYTKISLFSQIRPGDHINTNEFFEELLLDYSNHLDKTCLNLGFGTPEFTEQDIDALPVHSFQLFIQFKLASRFTSKDETLFYFHNNPIKKEWVSRVPCYPATGWKGSFRTALRYVLKKISERDKIEKRLLGSNTAEVMANDGDEQVFHSGRLNFFWTFFNRVELDTINPHSRETQAGTTPIKMEVVPRGSEGSICLLYVPIVPQSNEIGLPNADEVKIDLKTTCLTAHQMLYKYGFGAKTSSGFGRITENLTNGHLTFKSDGSSVERISLHEIHDLLNKNNELHNIYNRFVESRVKNDRV